MAWYDDWESAEEAHPELDLDNIYNEEAEAGKHDCTYYSGMVKHTDGTFRTIWYEASYNNGVQQVEIGEVEYEQYEEVVTRTGYRQV